jgi:hypothetical protein
MHSLNTFGARTNHRQTRIHKTHHSLDLGETNTFPLIIYSILSHGTSTQMAFCPETPTPKILKVETPPTLGAHNFVSRLLIEMKSQTKLQPLLRAFQRYVARHLHARKLRRFLTFSGRKSNCQFDSRPFFWP